jgi:hypothetical protein
MSPGWHRIADELRSVARDRALAASNDPSPAEARLLQRESVLLERAAGLAQSGHMQRTFTPYALDGVVTTSDDLVVWGMSASAEDALRRLAEFDAVLRLKMAAREVVRAGKGNKSRLPLLE